MPRPAFKATVLSIRRMDRLCGWCATHDAGTQRAHHIRAFSMAMGGDRRRPARASGLDPVCDGTRADLHLRLRQTLARRGAEFGEFAAYHRLVHLLAHHPRLPVLRRDLAVAAAPGVARPPD